MSEWNASADAGASKSRERGPENPAANHGHHDRPKVLPIATSDSVRSTRHGSPEIPTYGRADPSKVLRAFNTWAFKREQPADPHLLLQIVSDSIALGTPISFVLYWGKGPRCRIAQPDIDCLDYLAGLARRVKQAYQPGASITLIFTDTHAELNGHW